MTLLISQDFDAGPNGASPTTTQLGATSITGTAPVYDSSDPLVGAFDLHFTSPAGSNQSIRWDYAAAANVWQSIYYTTPASNPTTNQSIATVFSGTQQVTSIRHQTDGTLAIRDNAAATVQTSSPLPPSTKCRVSWRVTPGSGTGHQLRVYVGTNRNGSTPDHNLTTSATNTTATTTDNVRLGAITGGIDCHIDRLRVDNANEPGPAAGSGPPTVNAGPDLTKETGGGPFTITATEVAGGSAIVARAWRFVSGTTVTLTNTGQATVTVTPPAGTGATVLGYTATGADGQASTEDTATITWVTPGQSYLPVADIAVGGWSGTPSVSPLAGNIDESAADSTDFISSPDTPTGQEYKTRLTAKAGPASTSGVFIEVQLWLSAPATSQSTVVKLYDSDGTTVRKAVTFTDLTTTPTVRQINLTSGEAAAITGWNSGVIVGIAATLT